MSKKNSAVSSQYLNIRNQNKNEILEDYVEAIQEISELKGDDRPFNNETIVFHP